MRPVNGPGLFLGCPVNMFPALGYDQVFVSIDPQLLLPNETVTMATYAVDQDMLSGPGGAFPVMISGPRVIADISRSEEHTSELQSLMRNSYAVFCLKKKKKTRA